MRFALLGNHPDGLSLAQALTNTGRHTLAAYSGPASGREALRQRGLIVKPISDLEEILADPDVEAVIVAGRSADRTVQLRRALQSERPVLCVHPVDATADLAYEAAMIQQDTRQVLLPILCEALHPGVVRLAELVRADKGPFGVIRLIELQRWSPERVLIDTDAGGHQASLPGWDILRALGGEVAEVTALAPQEEIATEEPLLLMGRFENGPLLRATFLPRQAEQRWRLLVTGSRAEAALDFPQGWPGPAYLNWHDTTGELHEETWTSWEPWTALVDLFEAAIANRPASGRLTWQDEVRCLELDSAVRRSVRYRRASTLEYQEANEEVGFKGTMTLVGCGLLWGVLLLLILTASLPASAWKGYLSWLIVLVLALFLGLQLLRWIIPRKQ